MSGYRTGGYPPGVTDSDIERAMGERPCCTGCANFLFGDETGFCKKRLYRWLDRGGAVRVSSAQIARWALEHQSDGCGDVCAQYEEA